MPQHPLFDATACWPQNFNPSASTSQCCGIELADEKILASQKFQLNKLYLNFLKPFQSQTIPPQPLFTLLNYTYIPQKPSKIHNLRHSRSKRIHNFQEEAS